MLLDYYYKLKKIGVIHNFGWLLFERFVRLGLGIFIGAWVARYLGPADYGTLNYFITYVAVFGCVVNFGLDAIIVRECALNPKNAIKIINNSLIIRAGIGLICWLSANILLVITTSNIDQVIVGSILSFTLLIQPAETFDLWFQSRGQNKKSVNSKLTAFILASVLKVIFILESKDIFYFCLAAVLESALTSIIMLKSYITNGGKIEFKIDKTLLINNIKESIPFLISNLAILLYMRVDLFFIKEYLGSEGVGKYSVGIIFSQFWYFIPVIISTAISPKLVELKNNNVNKYNQTIRIVFLLFLLMGMIVSFINVAMANFIISLIYGDQYLEAIKVLKIHSITNIFVFMGVAQNIWLINEKKGYINSFKTIIGLIIAALGNWYFIPIFGLVGAACTAVITYFITAFLINYFLIRKLFYLQIGIVKS